MCYLWINVTEKQKTWIAHLSNSDQITILPFDPSAENKYRAVKDEIQTCLTKNVPVEHHGATRLGISGQDEIDIYIPVPSDKFDVTVESLIPLYGKPKSWYALERARFGLKVDGKKVDVFVINMETEGWTIMLLFEEYLLTHPEALEEYRQLKENLSGESTQQYYKAKIEFMNTIMERVKNDA